MSGFDLRQSGKRLPNSDQPRIGSPSEYPPSTKSRLISGRLEPLIECSTRKRRTSIGRPIPLKIEELNMIRLRMARPLDGNGFSPRRVGEAGGLARNFSGYPDIVQFRPVPCFLGVTFAIGSKSTAGRPLTRYLIGSQMHDRSQPVETSYGSLRSTLSVESRGPEVNNYDNEGIPSNPE